MNKTKNELIKFIISGCCAVATDMAGYYLLSMFLPLSVSKAASFLAGTAVAYFMNKYYTFGRKEKSFKEARNFVFLYLFSLAANVLVNKISLLLCPVIFANVPFMNTFKAVKLFSFLAATGTSTIINFIGQKFWVFNPKGAR